MVRTTPILILAAAGVLAGTAQAAPRARHNPGLNSIHQPIVRRTDYLLDLATSGEGLPPAEAGRLGAWFNSLDLGYGDRIWVDQGSGYVDPRTRADIAAVAGTYGLLLNDGAPVTTGFVQPGGVRVIVSRTTASVPGCPDWSYATRSGGPISTDSNYGCAVNTNIAAMVADPNDLVLGQAGASASVRDTGSKAIRAYRDRVPTGYSGEVKSEKTGGK